MSNLANDWMVTAPGARDYAAVYLTLRDQVRAVTIETMRSTAGFDLFVEAVGTPGAAFDRNWAGIEAALGGNWSLHEGLIRTMAPVCARFGVALPDWRAVMDESAAVVRDALFARYGGDPARLKAVIELMQRFYDRAYDVFVEAYVTASQEQLQQSEALFQLTTIGQFLIDQKGNCISANRAFLAIYGLSDDALKRCSLASLFEAEEFARIQAVTRESAVAHGRASYDTVHLRADGSRFPVHVEAVRLSSTHAGGSVWALSIYDLTERQQVEALRARGRELEAENERVREANRVKSAFLANMSHELRTPLNAIIGFSELLEAQEVGPLTEQQRDFAHDIHTSGKHLLRLVSDLLDLAKVEAGKLELQPEPVGLEALVLETVQASLLAATERNVVVKTSVGPGLDDAVLDAARFRQVLYNYLSNAIKFSSPGGTVEVSLTAEPGDCFRLAVVDHGIGIAPADHGRLFSQLEQLDGGRSKRHAGTGLGLVLTKRLVEAQGGSVGVESALGLGSTFHAVLPLHQRSAVLAPDSLPSL